ncbi:MAG: M15 family metallopeptidase [Candidatus Dojkabacteria bacterium]
MSISLKSDEEITLTSTQNKLVYLGDVGVDKYYVLEISGLDLGERIVEAVFQDNFANKTTKQFDIARTPLGLSGTIPEDLDWPNATYIKDGNSLTAPANKGHKLSSDFQPVNLVNLRSKGLTTNAEELQLTGEAAEALVKMTSDLMAQKGKGLIIASGYRSYNTQVQTYLYWVSLYGQEHADTISARPGFSEHQLGTTLDFMSPDSGYDFVNTFDQTVAGQWLLNNSYKYGFVQSYPYGKSDITGYQYEAWHYRFIGTNQALEWKESGLTLKQYLEQQ